MKKVLIPLLVLAVAAVVFYVSFSGAKTPGADSTQTAASSVAVSADGTTSGAAGAPAGDGSAGVAVDQAQDDAAGDDAEVPNRPATELYASFDDALAALKKGAAEYDDLILEQFSNLPENCAWCKELYAAVGDMMKNPANSAEQRSFYAEVLAVSGRTENLQTLLDSAREAKTPEDKDLLMQALELAQGGDKIAPFLSDKLKDAANEPMQESIVAALTNQGSRKATELLYQYIEGRPDGNGFYASGTGPGEIVPQPETFPFLQEKIASRGKFADLAVKSLLNAGVDGLKIVMNSIANSKDLDADRKMLEGSTDHLSFDDASIEYLRTLKETSSDPFVKETADKYLQAAESEAAKDLPTAEDAGALEDGDEGE